MDVVELVLKVQMRHDKHTLKKDQEKRMEKYRPWDRWTDDEKNSPRCKLVSISPSIISNSGQCLPTPEFEYKAKLFSNPPNLSSDKKYATIRTHSNASPEH